MEQAPVSKEIEPTTFYLYCSLHGFLGPVVGELKALSFAQEHEEATDGWCTVVTTTEMRDPDACDQWQ